MARVSGSGSGSGAGGFSRRDGDRADRFRRSHRVGQTVRGRFLRRESHGLAWVSIDGQELLAGVADAPGGEHEAGGALYFIIDEMTPGIVLRELRLPAGASGSTGELVMGFKADVARFESLLAGVLGTQQCGGDDAGAQLRATTAGERRQAFLHAVAGSAQALAGYTALLARERAINARLAQRVNARYCYAPWLVPGAACQEVLVGGPKLSDAARADSDALAEIRYGAMLSPLGPVQVRMLHRRGEANCRVLLERAGMERPLEAVLDVLFAALEPTSGGVGIHCLGVSRVRPNPAGVLEGLLEQDRTPYVGLNRRV